MDQQLQQLNNAAEGVRQAVPQYHEQLLGDDSQDHSDNIVEGRVANRLRNLGRMRQGREAQAPPVEQPAQILERRVAIPHLKKEKIDSRSKQVFNFEEIDALKLKYPQGLKYRLEPFQEKIGDENRLDLADMIEGDKEKREKANFFACAICTMVVNVPMECKSCDSVFCKECIEPWTSSNEHCPKKCKGNEAVEFGNMHRFAQQELNGLKFKCKSPNCDKINKYSDALAHIHTCEHQLQACPQGCGMGIQAEDKEYHYKIQCSKTRLVCKDCDEDISPNDREQNTHNCFQTLKKLLAESRKETESLKQQLRVVPANDIVPQRSSLVDSEDEDGGEVHQVAEPAAEEAAAAQGHFDLSTCANGHELTTYSGCPEGSDCVCCDKCDAQNLHHQELYFRCAPCNYDICLKCATNGEFV